MYVLFCSYSSFQATEVLQKPGFLKKPGFLPVLHQAEKRYNLSS